MGTGRQTAAGLQTHRALQVSERPTLAVPRLCGKYIRSGCAESGKLSLAGRRSAAAWPWGERRVWTDPRLAVCAVAWFAGVEDPVLLRSFWEIVSGIQLQTQSAEPIQPLQINETFLWHIQQQIQDKLDIKLRSAPVASQVFICFCRDKHTLAEMHRRNKKWSESTIKLRIRSLRAFLKKEFNGLTLESFFVDRSIFSAAEKQLADYRAKNISPLSVGELHNKDSEND